jgi:hypothetical protein
MARIRSSSRESVAVRASWSARARPAQRGAATAIDRPVNRSAIVTALSSIGTASGSNLAEVVRDRVQCRAQRAGGGGEVVSGGGRW